MLYLAASDDLRNHHGTIIRIEHSVFAPSAMLLADHANPGLCDGTCFRNRYLDELRQLWQADRAVFLDLIARARTGDVTLCDHHGTASHAPRKLLAAALKQIASRRRSATVEHAGVDSQRFTARDGPHDHALYANASDRDDGPDAPP